MTQIKTIPSDPSCCVKKNVRFFKFVLAKTIQNINNTHAKEETRQLWYSPKDLKQQRQEGAFEQSMQDEFANDRAIQEDVLYNNFGIVQSNQSLFESSQRKLKVLQCLLLSQEYYRHTDAGGERLHPSLLACVNRKKQIVGRLFKDQIRQSTQLAIERASMMERHAALCYAGDVITTGTSIITSVIIIIVITNPFRSIVFLQSKEGIHSRNNK